VTMTTTALATRRITGLQPTGPLHIGNLLGAIRPMVETQDDHDSVVFLANLHAHSVDRDPALVRHQTLEQATLLLAAGVDPGRTLFYVQSEVAAHAELHYLLECATGYGEAHRMIQFKEKAARQEQVRLSLLTYPVLMAADILLHEAAEVPVGDDQSQHLELARDVAIRFNGRYGPTFTVPRAVTPRVAARVMSLADPASKMDKTGPTTGGTLFLLDPPATIRRKVMRAVTDSGKGVAYDPARRPGAANLLELLAACEGGSPDELVGHFSGYGDLKRAVAEAVVAVLEPLQMRFAELSRNPASVRAVLTDGAERARERTVDVVTRAKRAMGLLP
jgi:tryptophanyl-tRNA synthetase